MVIDPHASPIVAFDARAVRPALRAAMRILELEQTTVPSVEELAERVELSAGYLSRQFTIAFGESPAAYGRRIRLNHAATRLLFAPVLLSEISRSFGFDNQPAFNRAFRRQHGAAPGAFVQHLRETSLGEAALEPAPVVHLTERPAEPALCRRFFGPDIGAHWRSFFAELPAGVDRPQRHAGLVSDSPAVVAPHLRRYDCAIPVGDMDSLALSSAASAGLDAVELPGGIHAEIHGCAPDAIGAAIRHLYTVWLLDQPAFAPEGDPMVHWWGEETDGITVTIRLHLLPDQPAWNMVPLDASGAPVGRR
jgi:AraC-like DNA-binding protein/DNA gyrase inhibitor GyrI